MVSEGLGEITLKGKVKKKQRSVTEDIRRLVMSDLHLYKVKKARTKIQHEHFNTSDS